MKTKHFLFGTLAAMLMFTSCQDDTALMGNEGEVMVSFNLETPQIATRAFSDGSVANLLQYAVYDQNGTQLTTHSGTVSNFTGSATINLKLSSGNTYSAIFWAANEYAPYKVDFANKTMTVDYKGALSNDETRDAFYKYQEFTVEGNQTVSVELKRPFAQLNIGTNDFAYATAASYAPTQSAVTVMDIANTLNLCNGKVSGEQDVKFDYKAIPAATETFPVDGYQYLAMNYILVGSEKEVHDIVYEYRDDKNLTQTNTVGSVPMQRNYRTNIYGSLLTNDVKVEVDMEPDYDGPAYYAVGNTYTVLTGEGFKEVATTVLSDASKNVVIELANDIDLGGIEWPAVCTKAAFVLDGKGNSIRNLTTSSVEDHGFYSTAMFTSTRKATTIKNLVVDNVSVTGNGKDNSHGAVLVACNYAALEISNVTVKNSKVSGCDRTGGLVTYLYFTTAIVKDCVVEGCTINSIGTAGAILGINNSNNFTMTGCDVVNTTVSSSEGSNKAGIFIGTWQKAGTLTNERNTHSGSKAINAGVETNNEIGRQA